MRLFDFIKRELFKQPPPLVDCVRDKEWYERQEKNSDPYPPIQNGDHTFYHDNGIKFVEGSYKNGKEDGTFTWYYGGGNKYREVHYKDGILNGPTNEWYENGDKRLEGTYQDGEIFGKMIFWNEDGTINPLSTQP